MKENFNKNNNPFILFGTMGRLAFFISNSVLFILTTAIWFFFCKSLHSILQEAVFFREYSRIYLLFNNSPKLEILIYCAALFALIVFKFILVKKRVLDIEQKNDHAIRNSYLVALLTAAIPLMINVVLPVLSKMNTVLILVSIFITLCLSLKKGAS